MSHIDDQKTIKMIHSALIGNQTKSNYDIDNCVRESAKSMASPDECYRYVMGKLSAKSQEDKSYANVTGKHVRQYCQMINDQTTVGFYRDLCESKSNAYGDTFQDPKHQFKF